jgi:UDP-N-acetylmuramoyl-tripeptide--D-alanyl-D-alanine ligase
MLLSTAAQDLHSEFSGTDVHFTGCSTDSRNIRAGEMFIALRGRRFDGHDFVEVAQASGAAAAMVETDYRNKLPLLRVPDTRLAMGRLAGLWRDRFNPQLFAITGSNGKTTVKEMLAGILALQAPVLATRGNLNNDIGVPLTLFDISDEHRYAVIEMGANHPGEIAYLSKLARPDVALITQCAPAHLDGFGSVDGVARAKAEIFVGLNSNGCVIINADDNYARFWLEQTRGHKQLTFGFSAPADVCVSDISLDEEAGHSRFRINAATGGVDVNLNLPGRHNIQNALAAAACAMAVDVPGGIIKSGLENARPARGRLQMKRGIAGSCIYDDTYNANPASLAAALKTVARRGGRHWLVLGDMGELGAVAAGLHADAGEQARELGFEKLFALGPLSRHAVNGFGRGARHFTDHESLTLTLRQELENDITVLVKGSRAMAMETIVNAVVEEPR